MADLLVLPKAPQTLRGSLHLNGSKSISNRVLMIHALAGDHSAPVEHVSIAKDTLILQKLLQADSDLYDAGDAGTTFRFMTAYLSLKPGTQILTGSARMRERPVGPLVAALKQLGASIEFVENEGFPPLKIGEFQYSGQKEVRMAADVSSQFLSALGMIGPHLPEGLVLVPEGRLVSGAYLEMTLALMRVFGAQAEWINGVLHISPGNYTPKPFVVEADWSAASYWYAFAALAEDVDLELKGLWPRSLQGDSVLPGMMESFGVKTEFTEKGIHLSKNGRGVKPIFEWDFVQCPDLAQTFAVLCGALGVQGLFAGLETLAIKETDRLAALKQELAKVGVGFSKLPPRFSRKHPEKTYYLIDGQASWQETVQIATYGDHRMAMAFAPLMLCGPIRIENPKVVEKSYSRFWEDLKLLDLLP